MNEHIRGEDLAAYVDGLLGADERGALENHFSRCPECLDELVEISVLRRGQDKVPAHFLKSALGEKNEIAKPALRLRLVFEVAAAFVVVVFIGYLFLDGNRFWQTSEPQELPVAMDKNIPLAAPSTSARAEESAPLQAERRTPADARKTKNKPAKTNADQDISDSFAFENKESTAAVKSMPDAGVKSVPISGRENKTNEIVMSPPRPALEKENLQKKELARAATIPETVGGVQMDSAAKDKLAAAIMEKKADIMEQSRERQKKSGAGAVPASAAKEGSAKGEEFLRSNAVTVPAAVAVARPVEAGKQPSAALAAKEISDQQTLPPVRIEGDAVWADLRNPDLLSSWSWLQKGLVLELEIDGAGTVIAVVPLGKIDPLSARKAENEAKKLLFSASKKKSRRARLVAKELPLN